MTAKEKFKERVEMFQDSVKMEKSPSRLPIVGDMYTWATWAYGLAHPEENIKLSSSIYNYDILAKVTYWYHENYPDDAQSNYFRNPSSFLESMGNFQYQANDEQFSLQVLDQHYLTVDDYDAMIEDFEKFRWEVFFPKKFPYLQDKEKSSQILYKGGELFMESQRAFGEINATLSNEYGLPPMQAPKEAGEVRRVPMTPFKMLSHNMQGLTDTCIALRRHRSRVVDVLNKIEELYPLVLPENYGSTENGCFDLWQTMLEHGILNLKDFGEFAWPRLKAFGDWADKFDKTVFIFSEGNITRLYDFLQEIPKGRMMFNVEEGDIFEIRKNCPNIAIAGGIPTTILKNGSKEDCIQYAQRLVNELGTVGYAFGPNKMMSYPCDADPENLKAVFDYIRNLEI